MTLVSENNLDLIAFAGEDKYIYFYDLKSKDLKKVIRIYYVS
jgi:hypothetical protein